MKKKDKDFNKEFNENRKDIVPSKYNGDPWLYVISPDYEDGDNTYSGKWCIIAPTKKIDKIWKKVFGLVSSGGARVAKVRTGYARLSVYDLMKINNVEDAKNYTPENKDPERVICVYVSDYREKEKVFALKDELRKLGIKEDLKFKTDEATKKGIYSGDEKEFLYIDTI